MYGVSYSVYSVVIDMVLTAVTARASNNADSQNVGIYNMGYIKVITFLVFNTCDFSFVYSYIIYFYFYFVFNHISSYILYQHIFQYVQLISSTALTTTLTFHESKGNHGCSVVNDRVQW